MPVPLRPPIATKRQDSWAQEPIGKIEVTSRLRGHLRRRPGHRRPLHRRCRDMRPDRRARRQKERHRRKPLVLAGQIEVEVQHEVGKIRETAVLKIHQQEGEVLENVD